MMTCWQAAETYVRPRKISCARRDPVAWLVRLPLEASGARITASVAPGAVSLSFGPLEMAPGSTFDRTRTSEPADRTTGLPGELHCSCADARLRMLLCGPKAPPYQPEYFGRVVEEKANFTSPSCRPNSLSTSTSNPLVKASQNRLNTWRERLRTTMRSLESRCQTARFPGITLMVSMPAL